MTTWAGEKWKEAFWESSGYHWWLVSERGCCEAAIFSRSVGTESGLGVGNASTLSSALLTREEGTLLCLFGQSRE